MRCNIAGLETVGINQVAMYHWRVTRGADVIQKVISRAEDFSIWREFLEEVSAWLRGITCTTDMEWQVTQLNCWWEVFIGKWVDRPVEICCNA